MVPVGWLHRRRWTLLATVAVLLSVNTVQYLLALWSTSRRGRLNSAGRGKVKPIPVGYRILTTGCTTPQFDPFDPSVEPYFRRRLNSSLCQGKPNFIYTRNGYAGVLEDKLEVHGVNPDDLLCFYDDIQRNESANNPADVTVFGNRQPLLFDKPLEEFIYVQCATRQTPNQTFHTQYLLNAILKNDVEQRCQKSNRTTPSELNILVLGLDSVSYLNMDRDLPRTAEFVRNELAAFQLRGYNKISDTSYPNQRALLTGLKYSDAWEYESKGFYDNVTSHLILQQYGERGYRTMFLEDRPRNSIVHNPANRFRSIPADYYPRRAIAAMEKSTKWITEDTRMARCVGPTMLSEELLDYFSRFAEIMSEKHFFAYLWINGITHSTLNSARYADETLRRHLESLHASGALDNTVLLLLSDHGLQYGDLRSTYIGMFEDRQPFAFVVFPPWFLEQNPKAARSLLINQNRLTTHFDVHATFVELLDYPSIERPQTTYGRSLLHEIPQTRTCADAHIAPHWCVCNVRSDVTVTSTLALAMANQLVSLVNGLVTRATRKCSEYRLLRVMDVTAFRWTQTYRAHNASHYRVTVQLSPGDAVFEGTARVNGGTVILLHDISRNDRYTRMSQCARGHWLEKYCYCLRAFDWQM